MIFSESRAGHLLATGALTASELDVYKAEWGRAHNAADAWLAVEIPKLRAKLAAWAAAVPLQLTEASATTAYQQVSAIANAYKNAADAFAAPYEMTVGDQPISVRGKLDEGYRSVSAEYAPLIQLLQEVRGGLAPSTAETCAAKGWIWGNGACVSPANAALMQQDKAWQEWELQSGPLFGELSAIFRATREPFYTLDLTQIDRAADVRDRLLAIARQLLGQYGGPAMVGIRPQKNLARATEQTQLAWQEANNSILSVKRVRDQDAAAGLQYGYTVDEYGNRVAIGSGFGFGWPLAILGGIAAILLIRRARS